jgi:protocatechuate 3,4-dioxygenase beta subunit
MIARRQILRGTAALAGVGLAGSILPATAWAAMRPTSAQSLGPFYPVTLPTDRDTDLTIIAGHGGQADGQIIDLAGRVLDGDGAPIAGARVEIWQANRHGRYVHPRDRSTAPLDPAFQGYGVATTDMDGRYVFRTIKPGAYPTGGNSMRPPHIHFAVTGPSQRLITQMYFPGEPLNDTDRLLGRAANPESLMAAVTLAGGALSARWDIVLARG